MTNQGFLTTFATDNPIDLTDKELQFYIKEVLGHQGPFGTPVQQEGNTTLKSFAQVDKVVAELQRLDLPLHPDRPKNWDSLITLDFILRHLEPQSKILDAGAEFYSILLYWLFLYGYENLLGGNLVFSKQFKVGPITYEYMDITKTTYPENHFDAATCMSVIEHGVDLALFFGEMSRIIKPGGYLLFSTDYFEEYIDTKGKVAYGCPIRIFNKETIAQLLDTAQQAGFVLTSPMDTTSGEKVVAWDMFDLQYSFVMIILQKK